MEGCLERHFEARLERREHVLVVELNNDRVQGLDKRSLFNDHVTLDYAVEGHQHNQVGVDDVAAQFTQEVHHAKRLLLRALLLLLLLLLALVQPDV